MPGAPVHAGSTYVHENLVVGNRWPGDFGEPQHLLGAMPYSSCTMAVIVFMPFVMVVPSAG